MLRQKNLRFKVVLWLLFFLLNVTKAQLVLNQNQKDVLYKHHLMLEEINETNFLVYKKNEIPKPTVIFIRGSDFIPMIVNNDVMCFPFDMDALGDAYNFIVASKPGIPVFEDSTKNKFLNESFLNGYYLNNEGKVPEKFTIHNNCESYTREYNQIIKYLKKQTWVAKDQIILMGHSQGAMVALGVGLKNKTVKKLILLSPASIFNRFYESIRKVRADESLNLYNAIEAQHKIDSINSRFKILMVNKSDNKNLFDGSTYYSYYSFTFPLLKDKILKLKQKTLLVYGTASNQDLDCDYLQMELVTNNKTNIFIKPYLNFDHNFFESQQNEMGIFNEKIFNFDLVVKESLDFINTP